MPELPEVEVVRAGLAVHCQGRQLSSVHVLHPRAVRRQVGGAAEFAGILPGLTVTGIRRRGKYLWWQTDPVAVVAHLGMSGQFRIGVGPHRHERVRFTFADGGPDVTFCDQRTFGGLFVDELVAGVPTRLSHIALDPLDDDFDLRACAKVIRRKGSEIKRVLLDQSVVSGIGNIYADEALLIAGVHGRRPAATLTLAQVVSVLAGVTEVMRAALAVGGTSFDALYVNVNGESGYFERALGAYGRAGQPCPRCQAPIHREAFMNRSSYFCPRCQKPPRR